MHIYVYIYVIYDIYSRKADANKHGANPRFDPHGVWLCGYVCDVIYTHI